MNTRKIAIRAVLLIIGVPVVVFLIVVVSYYARFYDLKRSNGTIVSSGQTREFLLHVPRSYDPTRPTPLVISMHATALWPAAQMETSQWNRVADEHGFLVVYPSGTTLSGGGTGVLPKVWHMGPRSVGSNVKFISELIDKLEAEYNIDATRIYADGLSSGGAMSFVVSCRLSHRIAAVGAVAAAHTLPWDWCGDSRPVPMVAFHGTDDPMVPYPGGPSGDPFNPVQFPAVRDWAAAWARRNRCGRDPIDARITTSVGRLAYTNCAENADVVLYTVEGGGHSWPGGRPMPEWIVGHTTREIHASRVMWAFFREHRLRKTRTGVRH